MLTVTTTTTTNTTGVEPNPSWHILIPHIHTHTYTHTHTHTHKHTHTSLQQPPASSFKLPVLSHLQCTCACPPLQSSQAVRQVQRILIAFLPVSPSLWFSNPPSLSLTQSRSLSLSLLLSSSTCGGNSLFNSLQHQPINSFADGWLAPAGAG